MKRKQVLYIILAVAVIVAAGGGYSFWYQGHYYIKTEDSRITGDIFRVMPRISAKITSLPIAEGDTVLSDQIVGQQDNTNLATSSLDQAALRSPIDGTVIKTMARVGEVVSPGQTVAMIVDKSKLYVSANIEEGDINRVKVGQPVDFTIDTFPGQTLHGKVSEIGEATAATFSLIPATNTSGNFTKVTQRIPIKISIDDQAGLAVAPGMSTTIKIHLKG
ncbi:HlyD family efflux transporter periplasmic adaptor subunit [Paenibacillus doosanensis]|uniref:Multidrug resistance protein EmrK n=1 Tax=Paenibacillus konkukensis TaxID=2020716 RepID=A0ABY4RWT2_9BACL|nr:MULTISPECIES: HlyD family efflux transporter periplasmic adaptor subunit [Paenibacillus]MCS7458859.1 HlyD family efflux transporter periplasmic adaptor subunit [Paenibacillus doosanensis]UQZ86612.1 putative multidrug resistance protein EmrK [Paenibacillus konkukensis]